MNLTKLFETQKKLDKRIVKEKGLEGQDLLPEKILALQVELGELAQNWRGFKFWSTDQKARTYEKCHVCQGHGETVVPAFPDFEEMERDMCPVCEGDGKSGKNPLLEEYCDCLHFILSIGLELELENIYYWFPIVNVKAYQHTSVTSQFIYLNNGVGDLFQGDKSYEELFYEFLALGSMLGFTWEQIEQAYFEKNDENHRRQTNGY